MKYLFTLATAFVACFSISSCKKNIIAADNGTDTLAQNIYTVTVDNNPTKGEILVAPFKLNEPDSGHIMVFNQDGKLLKEKYFPGVVCDFKKWTVNGLTRYTYIVNDLNADHADVAGSFTGYAVIADANLNEIKRVNLMPYGGISTAKGQSLDVHDFIYLSDDHYIQEAYYLRVGSEYIPSYLNPSPDVRRMAPVIQEVQNDAVIWQWDASTDTSFYANSVYSNDFTQDSVIQDYMHLNSMFIDPHDNNLIVSFRHQWQIIKLERGTGKVLWRLGGKNSDFPLRQDQVFIYQHDATLVDDSTTLMLFDNGDPVIRPRTRILEMKLDEVNKQVIGYKSFDLLQDPLSTLMGSVQKFDDRYFIGGGTGNYVLEINTLTGEKIFEMKSDYTTYRAFKYPD